MRKLLIASLLGLTALAAQAQNTILGTSFGTGNSYSTTFAGGVGATFTSAPGNFQTKSLAGVTGVGVTAPKTPQKSTVDRTPGEIDIGESIVGTFTQGIVISNISLGLLFDGPEYNDVNEVAQITATFFDKSITSFTLTATGATTALWSGTFGSVTSFGGGATSTGAGAWSISNPFGNNLVTRLGFTALQGKPSLTCPTCNNQSDYTLVSVTAVPEPESLAMMLAGLGLMGAIARRRKSNQA